MLERLNDGDEHEMVNLFDQLADDLGLNSTDRAEMLPGGSTTTYKNRIGWARTYLKKAGLIEQPGRGQVKITSRGINVLSTHPGAIDVRFLKQFPEFAVFHQSGRQQTVPSVSQNEPPMADDAESPEEIIARASKQLHDELAIELIEKIKKAPASFFEKVVVDLMIRMGYGGSREDAGRTVGRSGDGGIDGIINEDRLGLDVIYLQAKRWEGVVGRPVVQAFVGSLAGMRANKGVMVTTSSFSADARAYVQQIGAKVVLIDGELLGGLMIQHGLAVTTAAAYEVKRIDSDYFEA